MSAPKTSTGWKPTRNDWIYLLIILIVFVVLILGTSERKTKATPNDETHRMVTSHQACMQCHGEKGVRPQPPGHVKSIQCFQCHQQPKDWKAP